MQSYTVQTQFGPRRVRTDNGSPSDAHTLAPDIYRKFYTATGDLTAYSLACGYVLDDKRENGDLATCLWQSGPTYHVRTYDFKNVRRIVWNTYRLLGDARREYRRQCRLTFASPTEKPE